MAREDPVDTRVIRADRRRLSIPIHSKCTQRILSSSSARIHRQFVLLLGRSLLGGRRRQVLHPLGLRPVAGWS